MVRAICGLVDELAPDPVIGPREELVSFVTLSRSQRALRHRRVQVARELAWKPRHTFEGRLRAIRCYYDIRLWWERARSGVYRGERWARSLSLTV